ncbi:hypothetical protein [Oceanobacillus halotolerans]|uniref:hypothetical protein n=1 Tax=Oceanobacillus halotolerans TaxID=2663380 RepID=UPI0013DC03C8|nr:hypothetical protein [Oceanobacillus halotolerans]
MIEQKKTLYGAILILVVAVGLNIPFPHHEPLGETVAWILGVPVRTTNGFYVIGLFSLLLVIIGLYFLMMALKKYHVRMVVLTLVLVSIMPQSLADLYQKTFASDIYAIGYERESSHCVFDKVAATTLHGECFLSFENHSQEEVTFLLEFRDPYPSSVKMETLMNEHAPYEVSVKGNEQKNVRLETNLDVSELENVIENGTTNGVHIRIYSDQNRIREL